MNLIYNYISKYINRIANYQNSDFVEIFNLLQIEAEYKKKYKNLLNYVNLIIDKILVKDLKRVNFLHLHFEKNLVMQERYLILEFIILKFFYIGLINDISHKEQTDFKQFKNQLKHSYDFIIKKCPEGASAKKGGNRIYKKWKAEKLRKKNEYDFYYSIPNCKSLVSTTIINTLTKYSDYCLDLFNTKHYAIECDNIGLLKSYVVLNKNKSINDLDEYDDFIDNVDNLILYDCENSSNFFNFNLNNITQWNNDGARFKNLFIFTFGQKKININSLNKINNLIDFRFNGGNDNTYIITRDEINILSNCDNQYNINVNFFEIDSIIFWDNFLLESKIQDDLYELISIKMMNIYSLVLNKDIKEVVLRQIFENTDNSFLISEETKKNIPEDLITELRDNLSKTLDYIIKSNWKDEIKRRIDINTTLVVPNQFVDNIFLKNELKKELNLSQTNSILTWEQIRGIESNHLLILSYLDPGHYRYNFFPNIIELSAPDSYGLFLNLFFKNKFQWANYNWHNNYFKLLNHKIREDLFRWGLLKNDINDLKPTKKDDTYWVFEKSYVHSGYQDKDKVKIKFVDSSSSYTYHYSELFICKSDNTIKILTVNDLLKFNQIKISIQCLDDIVNALPIYDKLADINKQKEELDIIRNKFDIDEKEDAGRLWKILLKRKADVQSPKGLYHEIKELLHKKNLKMVSFSQFENHWINPDSNSLSPLVNRVFVCICNYLELPKVYVLLIKRIKNKTIQASRNNTIRIKNLYRDLFDDGCFDEVSNTKEILENKIDYYKQNHSLEEIGIDEKYLLENLVALVELIHPVIDLKEVKLIEGMRNEYD